MLGLALAIVAAMGVAGHGVLAQSYSFSRIVVEGNERVDTGTVLSYAEIPQGAEIGAAELNAAAQELRASGLFEAVEVVPQGGTLVIRVTERPIVSRVAFEGNRQLDDDELAAIVQTQTRRVYQPAAAEADARAIVDAYEARGNLAATVEPRIIPRGENSVDLVFEIAEGRVTENARISFVGNRTYSDRRLRRVLETKQAGFLRALFRSDTFIAERIAFDRTVLRDFYLSRGYVDFQVLDVTTELSRDRGATFITFQIREGQSFDIGAVTARAELPGVDAQEYLAAGKLRSNVTYSPTLVENAIARMEGLATQQGVDFLRIEPVVTRNNRELTLDIEFVLSRGPRVFVERIDIEGNQTTLDRVIRRQFRTVEGDPFDPREIRNAATRIRALNYFSTVDVQSRQGSAADQVVIDVDVEERPTGSLGIGGSYSTDNGIGVNLSFRETNFLGRGQRLNFELNTTSETGTSQLSFTEPALLGRNLSGTLGVFQSTTDNNNSDFASDELGFNAALGFPLGEFSDLRLRYEIDKTEISDVTTSSSPILQADVGEATTSAVGYTYRFDTRTEGLDPNRGVLVRFGQDLAGVGGDVEFLRTRASASYQQRFRNDEYSVRATLEGGNLAMLGDSNSRITDRFFLSSSQLRGFEFRGIGPRDLGAANRDALGGLNYVSARFEFGFPIGFVEDVGISGGLFLDVGSVWSLDNTAGAGGAVDDGFALRSSVGLSIFWDTAIGPLTFNFAEAIQKEDFDETRTFDIALTARF